MMENKKKIGLLIIISAILLLIIIILMFYKKKEADKVNEPEIINPNPIVASTDITPTSTPGDLPRNYQVYDVTKEEPHQVDANDATKLASLFAQRLGSFSNQSDYGNVTDLKIFMTKSMKDWADGYVADLKAKPYSGEYYGITTDALVTKVLNYDETKEVIKILVLTERREDSATTLGVAYQQNMIVDLVKINGEWLVDNAVWEKK